jgi:hypothetical protein
MIYADSEAPGRHAALIAGIYNSDLVQQLADTFAPGQTRGGEIEAIGLPDLGPDSISLIEGEAVALADLVSNAANPNGVAGVYLDLTEVLRSDTSLRAVPRAWRPRPGPDSLSGTVGRVLWLEQVHTSGPQAKKVSTFEFDTTLEGDILRLLHRSSSTSSSVDYRISPDGSLSERHVDALSAWVQGLIYQGLDLRDIASVLVPTSLNRLVDLYLEAKSSLDAFVASYRSSRAKIESEIS